MPEHHLVLTEKEFHQLQGLKMIPLDKLKISEAEKTLLMEQAKKKHPGPGAQQIPVVVCGMVDDAVV